MNRRTLMIAVGGFGVSLTGCLSQGAPPEEQTDSPTPSPADEYGFCPDDPDLNDITAWPEKPDSLTRETVARFVTQYEEAFRGRLALPADTDNITAVRVFGAASKNDVTRTDGGWLAHFLVSEPDFVRRSPTPTKSSHDSRALYPVSYFVSDDAVFRAMENKVDPQEKGNKLNCHRTGRSGE